jgi:predicted DNA-binding transcriptional regulator AlpA
MARNVLRLPGVIKKTGWPKSTVYEKIKAGLLSKGLKLDPLGHDVIWFEDEIDELQNRAIEPAKSEAA